MRRRRINIPSIKITIFYVSFFEETNRRNYFIPQCVDLPVYTAPSDGLFGSRSPPRPCSVRLPKPTSCGGGLGEEVCWFSFTPSVGVWTTVVFCCNGVFREAVVEGWGNGGVVTPPPPNPEGGFLWSFWVLPKVGNFSNNMFLFISRILQSVGGGVKVRLVPEAPCGWRSPRMANDRK